MARFDQAFKDEVRTRNDIVELISSYVKLERRGNRFVGLCPFHGEKTPSFHVIPDMQIYHCFGCKASGDVFKFVQEREHMSFYEALVHLAKRARIPLPQEERTPEEEKAYRERRALYDALDLAARFFHNQLLSAAGQSGLEYLRARGITDETIQRFQLGWAPGMSRLTRTLSQRFHPEISAMAGLVMPRREGAGYVDAFFERVMFPITDVSGRVIGFGGRILQGNGPKYKNTSETPLFSKRHVLFGLAQAKEAIRAKNQAILVEGYVDVIMPHQVGIRNVVAPLGTALTDEQCQVLRRQAEQVIVSFDSDTAGQMATLRGLEKLYDTGCDVRILRLPDGKDPDEFIRTHGVEAFQRCIDQAVPLIEFKLDLALEHNAGNAPETKAKALDAVARVLIDLKNDLLREEYVDKVASKLAPTAVEKAVVKQAIDRQMNRLLQAGFQHNQTDSRNNMRVSGSLPDSPRLPGPQPARSNTVRPRAATRSDLLWRAERTLLYLLLQNPDLRGRVGAELGGRPFEDPAHEAVYTTIQTLCSGAGANGGPLAARVIDALADSDAHLVITELAANPMVTVDSEKEAGDCIEKIKEHRDSRRFEDLSNRIRAAEASGQSVDTAVVLEYAQLAAKLKVSKS